MSPPCLVRVAFPVRLPGSAGRWRTGGSGKCFNAVVRVSEPGTVRQEKVTIRQVAAAAGVSIATVSRVLNGHSDVSAETRQAVERVLREQGYQAGGRRSPAGAPGLVGVTMPMVHPGYFAQILSGAAEALYENGMRAVVCPTRHSHEREASLIERPSPTPSGPPNSSTRSRSGPGWPTDAAGQALFDPLWGIDDPAAGAWFPQQALQLAQDASPALP